MLTAAPKGGGRNTNSARRQQVIDAAAATFARLGYHGTTTRMIADQLDIKVASLYFHIESKEVALEEVCTLGIQRSLHYLDEALHEHSDLLSQLRSFFQHQQSDLVAHSDYISVLMHDGRHLPPEAKARLANMTREFRTKLDLMLNIAHGRGELAAGLLPRQARFVLIGAVRSISELCANAIVKDIGDVTESWTEAVIRGIVASYSAKPETIA